MTRRDRKKAEKVEFLLSGGIPPALRKYSTAAPSPDEAQRLASLSGWLGVDFADPLRIMDVNGLKGGFWTEYHRMVSIALDGGRLGLLPLPENVPLGHAMFHWALEKGERKRAILVRRAQQKIFAWFKGK